MRSLSLPFHLSWAELAPARAATALGLDEVAKVALPAIPTTRPPDRRRELEIEGAIDAALQGQYGAWASGWRWSVGEGSLGGGPVRGWCCAGHSLWVRGDDGPWPSASRAAQGLLSWRDWILELSEAFARVPGGLPLPEALERHLQEILHLVVQRTAAEDAWYRHAEQVLVWFFESQGCGEGASKRVSRVLRGRFESWVGPSEPEAQQIASALRDELLRERGPVEALQSWGRTRQITPWLRQHEPSGLGGDDVLEYVLSHDAELSDERGMRMLEAHARARAAARGSASLRWRDLQGWMQIVHGPGADVGLRAHDAWAKDGRERYARVPDLQERVDQALADASDPALSAVARAARVYLDLCFLHPLADGNARAARLALDFVLVREGLSVRDPVGLLFRLPLPGGDPEVGTRYQALLARLVRRAHVGAG